MSKSIKIIAIHAFWTFLWLQLHTHSQLQIRFREGGGGWVPGGGYLKRVITATLCLETSGGDSEMVIIIDSRIVIVHRALEPKESFESLW